MNHLELDPWLILIGQEPETRFACWHISHADQPALAVFSTRTHAERYAGEHCSPPATCMQLPEVSLLRMFADSYRQGVLYAALDPSDSSARQLFVLRDVLQAARQQLHDRRML